MNMHPSNEEPTLAGMPALEDIPTPSERCLEEARRRYGEDVTASDLWHYIYGVFHAPDWRERFADELETSAPRFPWVPPADYPAFRDAGEELMTLHADFDQAAPHPAPTLERDEGAKIAIGPERMKWLDNDLTCLEIGEGVRLTGIPAAAHDYRVAGFSPVQWAAKNLVADPDTGEDPMRDPRWRDDPGELITHLRRLIHIGCRTAQIVKSLPPSLTDYPPAPGNDKGA